ncbi:MAG: hypothetical protein PF481_06570 [Bacteroidales bacterium]|jgi:hypothetical protein|nr:hypothetical protein [Bacteroidales bacterium]
MNKITFYIVFLLFAAACQEEPDHSLRIENENNYEIFVRLDDSIEYTIEPLGHTDYRPIEEGYHEIDGEYAAGFTAGFTIGGNGVHKWSVIVQQDTVILVQKL